MKKTFTFAFLIFLITVVFIFRNWFTSTLLTGGDWVYYYPSMVKSSTLFASWDDRYSGIGNNKIVKLPLEVYFVGTMKLAQGMEWQLYERLFWFLPFLLFSISSSFLLTKKIIKKNSFALLGSLLYTTNTYALMLIGGGQNGVALAYSCLPFLVLTYLNLLENSTSLLFSLLFTISLSAMTLFDVRIVYVGLPMLLFATLLYLIAYFPKDYLFKRFLYIAIVPGIITFGLHAFWILPLLFNRAGAVSQFGDVYTGADSVKFFSFASFENTLGLLHPNWPDNVFGKVGFMRVEFLLYPLLAFSSLLFLRVKRKNEKKGTRLENLYILYFLFVAFLGIFLAKGANDPFGGVYLWLFAHIPGFVLFRDPTKWYMIIAVSYSVVIPYSILRMYELIGGEVAK